MNRISTFLPMLVLGVLVAQSPVPLRAKTATYGLPSGYPEPLDVALAIDATTPLGPMLSFTGGQRDAIAVLAVGLAPASVTMPQGTILLVDPLLTIPGIVDAEGRFGLPVDILNPSFVGFTLYCQGLHWLPPSGDSVEFFQMPAGLEVAFVEANKQPDLTYVGPPVTATLLAKRVADLPATHEVYASVLVPTGGYDLRLTGFENQNGVTYVYATLEAPNPEENVSPVPETKRLLTELGVHAEGRIELMIDQQVRRLPTPPLFALAAMFERDF